MARIKAVFPIFSFSLSLIFALHNVLTAQTDPDTPFIQEYHQPHIIQLNPAANDLFAIELDKAGNVWAGGRTGVFVLPEGQNHWVAMLAEENAGPVFDILADSSDNIWIAAWNGLHKFSSGLNLSVSSLVHVSGIANPLSTVAQNGDKIIAAGPDGWWEIINGKVQRVKIPCSRAVKKIIAPKGHGLWAATGMGLYYQNGETSRTIIGDNEIISPYLADIALADDGDIWAGGLGGITVFHNGKKIAVYSAKDGFPSSEVTCVEQAPDGRMWVGTKAGIGRYDGTRWSVRHSQRWLLDDDVRDIAFDKNGTAWIATRKGVSAILQKDITLAQKADQILDICYARHVREPYLVGRCGLTVPGDTSSWTPLDDDNDGQYTAMYLAMESYRYAATKNPQAKENARKAFEALKYLQEVTETPGFFARTVVPANWDKMSDPNYELNDRQWALQYINNPREKRVHQRWHLSKDKKWLWKSTTSSDEMTGHMWGYYVYHKLVAEAQEKKRVAQHVGKIVSYVIDCNYTLHDLDGKPTEWAVWTPEKLNHDPDWLPERGINSLELLSYLKLAYSMTGDKKFDQHYKILIEKHGYAKNALCPKNTNPGLRTHIDDELLALAFPALVENEREPTLRKMYLQSVEQWWNAVKGDQSAYFNFIYGSLTGKDHLQLDAMDYLRDAPIDQIRWTVDNSKREDVSLTRLPEFEKIQTSRLLPPSERGILRWDNNPWEAVQGNGGRSERTGVQWLLPYWMGRYLGYIGE
ncbi:MAG: regulator [Deferribacteres bacterium]|nr:regulator [candidate division KSB1 bacterium]MCB9502610.1 regulator [Deferribacteres bacterium]